MFDNISNIRNAIPPHNIVGKWIQLQKQMAKYTNIDGISGDSYRFTPPLVLRPGKNKGGGKNGNDLH